jgi:hypothetical protein
MKQKAGSLKKINKIDKSLTNLTKMRREKTQISKIRNEKGKITTPRKSKESSVYFENLYSNKLENLEEMNKFLDSYDHPKSFCTTKEMVSKMKRTSTEWETISTSYTSDKGLITRIYRKLKKLNFPKINEPIKKWATELNRIFF